MPHHTDPPPTDSPLTRRTLLQRAGGMAGLAGVTLLMACGSSKANSAGNAAPPLATVEPATAPLPPFNGIPQGRTPEGFPTLGEANAPVTLIDYSDFL